MNLLQDLEELEQEKLTQKLLTMGNKEEEPPVILSGVPYTHLLAGPGTQNSVLKT